jgi:hypothetical protein
VFIMINMSSKKVLVAVLIIVVAIGGFVAGLSLLKQRQDLREQAAVPAGKTEVSISPSSGNFNVGDTFQASVSFNTASIAISGVAARLTYVYSGSSPEMTVDKIEINPSLLSTGDWTCPTQSSSQEAGNVVIDIACANTSAAGFTSNANVLLAKVDFKVQRTPAVNPIVVRFDPAMSVITQKSNSQDILLIPSSTGTYTIAGGAAATLTPTATPTKGPSATPTPTSKATGTPTPTTSLTTTPTSTVSATLTPTTVTTKGGLPEAGVSYPTFLGVGAGILVIILSVLLAF